jgi:asparagine synthase (glutamine-hydrolysing)
MTALAAYWALKDNGVSPPQAAERMLRGQQVYAPEAAVVSRHGNIAIGRRLFATVPEDVHDRGPIMGGAGRWMLVADVRLDARDELCRQLAISAGEAKLLCDSAIVMRAVERWQEEAIPRLIGDFALILWDTAEARLILARDFLGHRPLHYYQSPRFVAAASMPKGLHALPEVPREPNEHAVAEFLALLPESGSASFFRHVDRVAPGEIVIISADGLKRRNYWDFEYNPLKLRDDEYIDATREAFDRAVRARLRGVEGAVGTHLSGGLDSSATSATAARLMAPNGQVIAFTAAPAVGFEERRSSDRFNDESDHAAAVAAQYPNVEHVIVRSDAKSPLNALDRNFFLFDRPLLNLCNAVWTDDILDLAKARGLKVLLTGEMGNMTTSFGGLQNLSGMLARGSIGPLLRETALLKRNGMPLRRIAARTFGPFVSRSMWEWLYRLRGRNLDVAEYTALRRDRVRALTKDAERQGRSNSTKPSRDGFALRKAVLRRCDEGNYVKGYLGGWGIDLRDPTADRRLVELCLSIPVEQYLRNGQTRALARRAFADRLPPMVLGETRAGYQGADWHRGLRAHWSLAREETERIACLPAAAAILDAPRLRGLLELDEGIDWNSQQTEFRYRLAFLRGISGGHFLRRATGAN